MDYYTESQIMFSDKFYEIIAKHQLNIHEIVFDYFAQLSEEDLHKIEEKIIECDSMLTGKFKILAELSRLKLLAQEWKNSREAKNKKSIEEIEDLILKKLERWDHLENKHSLNECH